MTDCITKKKLSSIYKLLLIGGHSSNNKLFINNNFIKLKNILSGIYQIYWSLDELIDGKKDNFMLHDKLLEGDTKIDVIFKCDDLNYIEVTNVYSFIID